MSLTIRRATIADLKSIQSLKNDLDCFRDKNFSKQNKPFHQKIKTQPKIKNPELKSDIYIVAEENNTIIAYALASLHKRKLHKLSKLGFIDEIFIEKKYRSKGLGKSLFKFIEKELIKLGCDHIVANTDQENELAQKFYTKQKMKPVTIEYWKKI